MMCWVPTIAQFQSICPFRRKFLEFNHFVNCWVDENAEIS
jgi:hypothetical protein